MQLLELAFQGVRGFNPSLRVQLKAGYWVLQPSVQGTPPLGSLLVALLFSDGRGGDASFAVPGQTGANAGMMLQGNDNQTYWLVRNLGHSGALHRYVPATQKFDPVSSDAGEIGQFVRAQLGVPPRGGLEGLFTFNLGQLPTHRPRPKPTVSAMPAVAAKPKLASAAPVQAAQDIGAAQQRLAELEKERLLSDEVEKLQFKVDGVASRIFKLETELQGSEAIRTQLEEAHAALLGAPTPESLGLPPDILTRVDRYPQLVAKRDEAMAKLEAEREQEESGPSGVDSLSRDVRFWAAVGVGLACLVGGAFASGAVRYVALLDIPAFGVAALLALRYLDDRQQAEKGKRKGSRLAEREQKIHDQFDAEMGVVRAAMKTLNVDAPAGIREVLAQKAVLEERHGEIKRKLEEAEAAPDFARAREELTELKAEQAKLDAELTEKGAYVRDAREVERDVARVKESIQLAQGGGAPASPPTAAAPVAAAAEAPLDPMPPLMSLAADLFALDLPSTVALVKDRTIQYLSAFTDRRVTGVEMDVFGKASVVTATGKVPATGLPGSDLNLLYLAARFAILEKYSVKFKVPVVLEDVMAGLDPDRLALMGKALKALGKLTQVLHVTEKPEFAEVADGQVQV